MKFLKRLFKADKKSSCKNRLKNISAYRSVNGFWKSITQDDRWYVDHSPQQYGDLQANLEELAPLIIETTNGLRYNLDFKNDDYWKIIQWDNLLLDSKWEDKLKQYCSNCKREVGYSQRYPKSICHNCKSEVASVDGRKVEFFNTHWSGAGCQGYYCGTNQNEKYDSNECYIGTKVFIAEEGKFGGIVIELKD